MKNIEKIKQIIEVFETGKVSSNYGIVALLSDGAGISYGKSQATDGGGNLDSIIMRYFDKNGIYSKKLEPYLDELKNNETTKVDPKNPPLWVKDLMSLLKEAGEKDPKMALAQDEIFDEMYWQPALNHCNAMRLILPLSYAVVYDSCIHSGPNGVNKIRRLFPEVPPASGGDEKKWTTAYIKARRNWLSNFSNPVVQKTVYRMDTFLKIIQDDNWNLEKPFTVLGVKFN